MKGYVRVTNVRVDMAPDSQPEEDEITILVDRTHACLGNPHILRNKNDSVGRQRVLALYKRDLDEDFRRQGPKYRAIKEIAEQVRDGAKVVLLCHCIPLDCHASLIAEKVNVLLENKPESPRKQIFR